MRGAHKVGRTWQDMAGHETDETDGVDLGLKKMGDAGIAQVLAFFQPNRKKSCKLVP